MLEQIKMIFGLGSTVIADAMNKKVERLNKRLDSEKKGVAKVKPTELLLLELLELERIHRMRGAVYTADLLKESADRLHETDKIAEYYRQKAEANTQCRN